MIWIDIICIDQVNDTEKSRQVQLMADISRRALNVLVSLGQVSDNAELVGRRLSELARNP